MRRPRQLIERLYAQHFRRPVPRAVYAYIDRHIRPNNSAVESDAWQYKYGTSARSLERVEQRWKEQLEPWEVREIEAACGRGSSGGKDVPAVTTEPAAFHPFGGGGGGVGLAGAFKAARPGKPGKGQRRNVV